MPFHEFRPGPTHTQQLYATYQRVIACHADLIFLAAVADHPGLKPHLETASDRTQDAIVSIAEAVKHIESFITPPA